MITPKLDNLLKAGETTELDNLLIAREIVTHFRNIQHEKVFKQCDELEISGLPLSTIQTDVDALDKLNSAQSYLHKQIVEICRPTSINVY